MLHFKIDRKPQSHVRKMAAKFRCYVCLKEFAVADTGGGVGGVRTPPSDLMMNKIKD